MTLIHQFQNIFQNVDLLLVGIAITAITTLGAVIFFNNPRSATAQGFLLFSVITAFWSVFNYSYYTVDSASLAFWLLRVVIFFGVWHAFSFFNLSFVFPESAVVFPRVYLYALLPLVAITSVLVLTPFVFSRVTEISNGSIIKIENGPGIVLFTSIVISLIIGGIFLLIQKTRKATQKERPSFFSMLVGVSLTFALLLTFNFVLPAFFSVSRFIPFGSLFLLPFAFFTFYAIVKRDLLNIKVVAIDILVFFLSISTLFQVLVSHTVAEIVFRVIIFFLLLAVGILLIRNTRREIKQRELLEQVLGELQVANEELKKLDEQKSDFITIASHQLRTPLTVIKGYVSLIFEKNYGAYPREIDEPLNRINISNNRLINLVNDLLDLSRIERGKMTYVFQNASPVLIADEVFNEMGETAKEKKLELCYEKPEGEFPFSSIDSKKIKEVMMGFVENAIRYTPEGLITMKLLHDQNKRVVRFSVADTGIGLTQDEINQLFVKFSRMDSAKRISSDGTGLGLYVAKLIIEDHKGKIWVESEGHGKGSIFIFELPFAITKK